MEGTEMKNKGWNKMTQKQRDKQIEEFAKILGIDLNAPPPNLLDPQVISRLAKKFTKDCLGELEKDNEMQAKAIAGARDVVIPS